MQALLEDYRHSNTGTPTHMLGIVALVGIIGLLVAILDMGSNGLNAEWAGKGLVVFFVCFAAVFLLA